MYPCTFRMFSGLSTASYSSFFSVAIACLPHNSFFAITLHIINYIYISYYMKILYIKRDIHLYCITGLLIHFHPEIVLLVLNSIAACQPHPLLTSSTAIHRHWINMLDSTISCVKISIIFTLKLCYGTLFLIFFCLGRGCFVLL